MRYRGTLWFFILMGILIIASCTPAKPAATLATPAVKPAMPAETPTPSGYVNPELLVETDWLAARLKDASIRIVDLRSAKEYEEGHIEGSVNIPRPAIYDPDNPVKGMILPQAKWKNLLESKDINNNTVVVAVDNIGGEAAARFFWSLEYYGHGKSRLLNGGFNKWIKEGRVVTQVLPKISEVKYSAIPDANKIATKQQVLEKLGKKDVIILDVRSAKEYRGEDVRSKRGGHIPGAINLDWNQNLTTDEPRVLKPAEELKRLYENAGVTKDKEIIIYCQTGTRASHTYFVLRLLGYNKIRVYDGAWEEWGNDLQVPVEK